MEAGAQASKAGVKGDAKVTENRAMSFARSLQLVEEYSGGEPNIDAAVNHLRKWRLDGDRELGWLVESRSVESNPLQQRTLTLDLNRESERSLDLVANLKIPAYLSIQAAIKKATEASSHFKLEYSIEF